MLPNFVAVIWDHDLHRAIVATRLSVCFKLGYVLEPERISSHDEEGSV